MSLKEKAAQRRQRVFHKQLLTMSQQEKAARRRRHLFKSNVPTRKKPAAGAESFRNNVHNKKSSPPQAPFCRKPQVASACKGRVRGSRARGSRDRASDAQAIASIREGKTLASFYFSFFKLLYRVREGETLAIFYFWVPDCIDFGRVGTAIREGKTIEQNMFLIFRLLHRVGEGKTLVIFLIFQGIHRVREGETLAIFYFWLFKLLYRFRAGGNSRGRHSSAVAGAFGGAPHGPQLVRGMFFVDFCFRWAPCATTVTERVRGAPYRMRRRHGNAATGAFGGAP
jgi:hypothetical protein